MVWKCPNTANESSPEPLESGKDKQVKITIESDSEQDGVRYQQRKNRPHGLVSLSEHVENYSSKISNKINGIIQVIFDCLLCFIL